MNCHTGNQNFRRASTYIILGETESFKELLTEEPGLLTETEFGETLLHFAVDNSELEITSILLNLGSDINLQNSSGETPLHLAVFRGEKKIVKLLLLKNANPNIATHDKKTPLHYALDSKEAEFIKILLFYGANPLLKDINGHSPMNLSGEFSYLFPTVYPITSISEASPELESTLNSSRVQPCAESEYTERIPTERYSYKEELFDFLNKLSLANYYKLLVGYGFDDLNSMVFQMKTPLPITHDLLAKIGIKRSGHRSKLITKLEKEEFKRPILLNSNNLVEIFYLFNLQSYYREFVDHGYDDLKMLIENAFKEDFLSDELLLMKMNIEKPGHRLRIIGIFQFLATTRMKRSYTCILL